MPCDQVRKISVDVGKMQPDLLEQALKNLGYQARRSNTAVQFYDPMSGVTHTYVIATGQLVADPNFNVNKLKQAYSAEIVKSQAKKYNWQLKEVAPFQYHVTKR